MCLNNGMVQNMNATFSIILIISANPTNKLIAIPKCCHTIENYCTTKANTQISIKALKFYEIAQPNYVYNLNE